jgi:hypothetical protein
MPSNLAEQFGTLKQKYAELLDLRVTQPEAQVQELVQRAKDMDEKHATHIGLLQRSVQKLESQAAKSSKLVEEAQRLRSEVLAEKEETLRAHAKCEQAEQERAVLAKALDSLNAAGADAVTSQRMMASLNAYMNLTGIALLLDEVDFGTCTATYFNLDAQRVAKLRVTFAPEGGDNADRPVEFAPLANASLLPAALQAPLKVPRRRAPLISAQIAAKLFD